jgi:CRISPR-associated protein Csb1
VPATGSRFQPTGFPDLGAAVFSRPTLTSDGRPGWERAILVESAQSMANRLEAVAWDSSTDQPADVLDGLPYVRVLHSDGGYLTSSRTEAHRLSSAFVKDAYLDGKQMRDVIRERLDLRDDRPVASRRIAEAIFALDPLCLIHGVFFAEKASVWPGQPKVSRAVTAFIEATDVERAESGGVKRDHVRHSISEGAGGTAEGYGTVPFHRTEWTAASIRLHWSLDRAQLRSYGLGDDRTRLLETVALWELRALVAQGLRLRTACDLLPEHDAMTDQSGDLLPDLTALSEEIAVLTGRIGHQPPLEVRWDPKKASKARSAAEQSEEDGAS